MTNKPICWMGSSLEDLSDFPESARRKAGFQLRLIQGGEEPSDFKPMSIVGSGVEEIRIRADDSYRIFYVARFEEAVYVLGASQSCRFTPLMNGSIYALSISKKYSCNFEMLPMFSMHLGKRLRRLQG